MITPEGLEAITAGLNRIESIAVMSTASSTNTIARRVIDECIENEIAVPQALIVAREQRAGRGRESRSWSSPRDAGLWTTILGTIPQQRLALFPLHVALVVSEFIDSLGVHTALKWPNDIMCDSRKIGGILIEARTSEGNCHVAIGTGINVYGIPVIDGSATVEECGGSPPPLDDLIGRWAAAADELLAEPLEPAEIVAQWTARSYLAAGDHVASSVGGRRIDGSWIGIDASGHARIATVNGEIRVSAGDIVRVEPS